MSDWILWIKALHVMSVIAWMAALFYLPRLFVYHTDAAIGSVQSETFKVMERRLAKAIMTPSMIGVWITGPILAYGFGEYAAQWFHAKVLLVIGMSGYHGYLMVSVKRFANDTNQRSSKFFRFINEIPTVLMAAIVVLVIVKPF